MTKYYANNILLARNLPFESDVRQWSHLLMIPLHCLWAKSSNRTRGQFEYDVTYFFGCLFLFDFVHLHAWCGCCSIVYWHFHVRQAKQVDRKMSTEKTFRDIFGQLQTRKSRYWGFSSTSASFRYTRKKKKMFLIF